MAVFSPWPTGAGKYADLGLDTIADRQAHLGPMGGIDAALRHCEAEWLLLAACDQLMVKRDWVEILTNRVTRGMASGEAGDGADAVAYRGRWYEPMPAMYRNTLAPLVNDRIASGERSMQGLLKSARTMAMGLPSDWIDPPSVNTPEDLERFKSREP